MTQFGAPPQPIDARQYEEGYKAKMDGKTYLFGNWTSVSWRAGWFQAKQDQQEPNARCEEKGSK
jgi:hypothetical protein